MSLEKIVAEAMEGNPLNVKELFEEEMRKRVAAALEESYKRKMRESDDEEKNESFSEADLEALIEEMDDETYAEFVEELGQLDELDKATLASYRKKAKTDVQKRAAVADIRDKTNLGLDSGGYVMTKSKQDRLKNAIRKDYRKLAKAKMAEK